MFTSLLARFSFFNPWVVGAIAVLLIGTHGYVYHTGVLHERDAQSLAGIANQKVIDAAYKTQVEFANKIAAELEIAKQNVRVETKEVIKYVNKVTDNRACLSLRAVRLLNGLKEPAGFSVPGGSTEPASKEAAGPSASDGDVYLWIADAREQYKNCAADYNALVDIRAQQRSMTEH